MKNSTKSISFVPITIPGVGSGASCRGGVGHPGVGCVIHGGGGGVRWAMQGWGGSCRGGVGHTGVGWVR